MSGLDHMPQPCAVVVASLALPPPITGQTLINSGVVQSLKKLDLKLSLVDTSPKSGRRSILYHLRRLSVVTTVPIILGANAARRNRSFYTVAEPGWGIGYNIFSAVFARLFGYRIFLHHHAS